jgi:nucleobase:cation symporter-1, NCS1 family
MNDILNLAPQRLSFRACGYACLCIALLVCPWWLFSSQRAFVLTFLSGYASVTGAIAGVLLTDFWVLRKGVLELEQLYRPSRCWEKHRARASSSDTYEDGATWLSSLGADFNWRALVAVAAACAPCVPGFIGTLPGCEAGPVATVIYSMSWFVSLALAALLYWLFNTVAPRTVHEQLLSTSNSIGEQEAHEPSTEIAEPGIVHRC